MDDGDDGDSDDSSLIDSILNIPARIAERLKVLFEPLTSGITGIKDKISSFFSSWSTAIDAFRNNVGSWFTNLGNSFREHIGNFSTNVGNWFSSLKEAMSNALGEQLSNLKQGFENVKENFISLLKKIADLWTEINMLPQRIQEKIKEVFEYFFFPDEERTNQRLDEIRQKFAFVDSISSYGESLMDFLKNASGKKAPVITISLGSYKGSFDYGSGNIVIDFAWYEPYKPMVDNIIAGIIWAVWLWHMYKRIPDIIAGNSMTTASVLRATKKED